MNRQSSLFEHQEQAKAAAEAESRRAADARAENYRQRESAKRRAALTGDDLRGVAREFAYDIATGSLAGANGLRCDGRCSLADVAQAMAGGGYTGRVGAELFEGRLWAPVGGEWKHRFVRG